MEKIFGKIFPGGNRKDIPWLMNELDNRNISYQIKNNDENDKWFIFLIPENQLSKLPHDNKGPYLGNNIRGFTIYEITQEMINDLSK